MQRARSSSDSASAIERLGRRFESSLVLIAIATVFACAVFPASQVRAQEFTDFTTIDLASDIASGSIGSVSVTFSGTIISGGRTDNGFTGFNHAFFAPPLPASDHVNFVTNTTTFAYTITFGSAVTDPRLHLYSHASVLDFGTIPLTKLSGQDFFFVSGSRVVGALGDGGGVGPMDANGTVQLNGTFTSVNFTATTVAGVSADEIVLQIGVVPVGLPGDYNENGTVDAADFTVWRDHLGQMFALDNERPDAATPGIVDQEDYDFWKSHFGDMAGSGSGASATSTVPEPTISALLMLAAAGWSLRRGRSA